VSASLTIDCSSISQPDVVLSDSSDTYRLALGGFGRPGITWRTTYAPDSINVHGSEAIAAVKEQTSIPAEVIVLGTDWTAVETAIDALDAALSQWSYTVTQTAGGVTRTWSAGPASWSSSSNAVESYNVDQAFDVLTLTIPVYPIPGT